MKFSYSPSIFVLYSAQLEYVSEQSQLEFLQLLSDRARQRITYHCKNSVAWPEKSSNEGIKSIKMLTVNGLELHARSSNKFKPTLVGDDCAVSETEKKKEWDYLGSSSTLPSSRDKYDVSYWPWVGMKTRTFSFEDEIEVQSRSKTSKLGINV